MYSELELVWTLYACMYTLWTSGCSFECERERELADGDGKRHVDGRAGGWRPGIESPLVYEGCGVYVRVRHCRSPVIVSSTAACVVLARLPGESLSLELSVRRWNWADSPMTTGRTS